MARGAADTIDGVRSAVPCLQPEPSIGRGATSARILVHSTEPSSQLIAFKEEPLWVIGEDAPGGLNGCVVQNMTPHDRLGSAVVLRCLVPFVLGLPPAGEGYLLQMLHRLHRRADHWRFSARRLTDQGQPQARRFLPRLVNLYPDANVIRGCGGTDRQGSHCRRGKLDALDPGLAFGEGLEDWRQQTTR